MNLTNKHKKQFALFYLVCFVLSYSWYFYFDLLLCQVNPVFFVNRLDITRNLLMLTNLQNVLIEHFWIRQLFDIVYLLLPLLLCYVVVMEKRGARLLAIVTSLFSMIYGIFLASFTYISLDLFVAWFFIPLVFYPYSPKGFYYVLHSLRYIFILLFFSAGLWKIRAGGIFNPEQMSGILVMQHKQYLAGNSGDWFVQVLNYLIEHKMVSYLVYLLGTFAELIFIIGFFTRKCDRLLLLFFLLFFVSDYFLMRINYSNWMVFAGLLYFSKFNLQKDGV